MKPTQKLRRGHIAGQPALEEHLADWMEAVGQADEDVLSDLSVPS